MAWVNHNHQQSADIRHYNDTSVWCLGKLFSSAKCHLFQGNFWWENSGMSHLRQPCHILCRVLLFCAENWHVHTQISTHMPAIPPNTLAQSIKICLTLDWSVDNDLSFGTALGRSRLPTDWRLLYGLPISNSMTFEGERKQKCLFLFRRGKACSLFCVGTASPW